MSHSRLPADSAPVPVMAGWPVLGVLPRLRHDKLATLVEARRDYGDFVRLRNPLVRFYMLSHPELIAHVLQTHHQTYRKGRFHAMLRPVMGNGLVTSDGPLWRRQRRMIQPAFQQDRIRAYTVAMARAADRLVARWQAPAARGATVDVAGEMARLALEVIVEVMFGGDAGDLAAQVGADMDRIQDGISRRFWALLPVLQDLPTPRCRAERAALRRVDAVVHRLAVAHRAQPQPDLLLSRLLAARDPETGAAMTARQLRDEVMTLFLAGHETTANALTWFWYLLAQHPEAEAEVQAEADAVTGAPGADDLGRLAGTERIIHEAMRLYPPVWGFSRRAVADDVIAGHSIRRGSVLFVSPYVMHRHPDHWARPETFDPARFTRAAAVRPRYVYMPFGGGPHACLGSQFALAEMLMAVPRIAAHYRLRLVPGVRVEPVALVTLRPRCGMPMRLVARTS